MVKNQIKISLNFFHSNYNASSYQAAEGIWTPDLLITNQPLHQLSYGGIQRPE
jgi:hypothetical protein